MTEEATFLKWFFKSLEYRHIEYIVLRNHETLPDHVEGSDIDMLVKCREYNIIRNEILKDMAITDYRPWKTYRKNFNMVQMSFVPERCISPQEVIRLDFLFNSVQWMGKDIVPLNLLWSNIKHHNSISVLDPSISAMLSAINSILYSGGIKQKYLDQFRNLSIEDQEKALGFINKKVKTINELLQIKPAVLRKKFIMKDGIPLWTSCRAIISMSKTLLTRLSNPPGDFIAMIGPDGSGKSTLADMIRNDCKRMYPGISYFHLFPKLKVFKKIDRKSHLRWEEKQRSGKRESELRKQNFGFISSLIRIVYLWLRFTTGYFFYVIPKKMKGELILTDRWCYDLILDPGSKGINLPLWIRKFILLFIPKPSGNLLLKGQPEVFAARKSDLDEEEIQMQIQIMTDYFSGSAKSKEIYTDQNPEDSFRSALTFLIR